MVTQNTSFTSAVAGASINVPYGDSYVFSLSGTYAASMILEFSRNLTNWTPVLKTAVANATVTSTFRAEEPGPNNSGYYRWRADTYTSGTAVTSIAHAQVGSSITQSPSGIEIAGPVVRKDQTYTISAGVNAKIGATAGWAAEAANNIALRTCPASQTASTLVLPITGLKVGSTITAYGLRGQIESVGGSVTLAHSLRKQTAAAADVTDALVMTGSSLVVTAQTAVTAANTNTVLTTPEVVADGEDLYILIAATTAASTDIALQGAYVTVNEA